MPRGARPRQARFGGYSFQPSKTIQGPSVAVPQDILRGHITAQWSFAVTPASKHIETLQLMAWSQIQAVQNAL
jgi:hypothetical protein